MNPTHVTELLDRAAASVTPTETDPAARLVSLGRRSVRRRRRAWGTAGSVAVAAAVAAVVVLPLRIAAPERPDAAGAAGRTVSLGGLSVAVPKGWRTSEVSTFDPCVAEPRTVYLAERQGSPRARQPGSACPSEGRAWMALVRDAVPRYVNPERLVVKDGRLLQVTEDIRQSQWTYRVFDEEEMATGIFVSGDANGREQLLERVTWPAGPAAPASGGLVLPDRITAAVGENAGPMVTAVDAKTLTRIRSALVELRDPVPAGEECELKRPGAVGIALDRVSVVLGDASCPQAISTGGGRVRAPAGLGGELLDLIVTSDRAAAERATGD
ncbi:hypothetical protein O7598_20540 [Micromonospora sp. WMMC241]|uniref:hypothetical protein n=1 Tax=Micromonospora sp. WMMC241 TaxID=3015159 RepID=UPI0022B5F374|nr:hypothetical protein [Micromonospora sp. WMMC241]MCZ7438813.1 hypothetical protein [Micromonospora sp. WMMC241]